MLLAIETIEPKALAHEAAKSADGRTWQQRNRTATESKSSLSRRNRRRCQTWRAHIVRRLVNDKARVNGSCTSGFDRVRDAFEANFHNRNEIGAAVAIWVDGELAVNLWGGSADAEGRKPWRNDTLASIFSGSKALTSSCIHLLADRGEVNLDSPVAQYWPEFAQAGKQEITIAAVL